MIRTDRPEGLRTPDAMTLSTSAVTQQQSVPPSTGMSQDVLARAKGCPANVLEAIYAKPTNKAEIYDNSLKRWWVEYAERKVDEEDEHVADSLLYDRRHLPRTAPAPDKALAAIAAEKAARGGSQG